MPIGRRPASGCGIEATNPQRQSSDCGRLIWRGLGAVLVCVIGFALNAQVARATDCQSAPTDSAIAPPGVLFQQIRTKTDAQMLNINVAQRTNQDGCIWIYDVRLLTTTGAVVELDYAAATLAIVAVRGPAGDTAAATLLQALGVAPSQIERLTSVDDKKAPASATGSPGDTPGPSAPGNGAPKDSGPPGGGTGGGPGGPGGGPGGGGPGGGPGGGSGGGHGPGN